MTNTILSCSILAVIVFGIQFALCLKTSGRFTKYIPLCVIMLFYIAALIMYGMKFCFCKALSHKERVVVGILECCTRSSCYRPERILCDIERNVYLLCESFGKSSEK